ncbi:efflux RND transporter periplasmic adaptor subunit [Telluria mixta]|uniref:Efflux RND transporter periplasmic adaptor subunit n=1 Tax=Telluria mixta TaxID=34071 RepID=A0ABT2BZD8_9BURK|nr:efflux RND transporter periplasmic adaptor subunit [Telluria mixta]MCS0630498.1 efflux RND transporter periplasmic adaptor subunit [Telluria mixta]WEM94198.1 efflux RND transporter periplasmic adaptor subunit [Telluria mixta]
MRAHIVFLACAAALTAGCESQQAAPARAAPPEVGVHVVEVQPRPVTVELPGRTSAYLVAEVRPQVGGLVQKRLFVEGADVKAGTQLYQIESGTYRASLTSAQAAVSRAEANLASAAPRARRYRELLDVDGVSRQDYDDAVAAEAQARADVATARAALETARINLDYTRVEAPISGRIGRSTVTPGALVMAGQETPLATVQQLDPIYVDVTQSAEEMLRLKRLVESGSVRQADGQARVLVKLADGSMYPHEGRLQFAGSSVDPGTGNVVLRAIVPNPKHELMPGMFVRAVIDSGVDEKAIAVPQQGITRNQKGEATALVLNRKGIVEQKVLVTSGTAGDRWLVASGLAAGDRVIVEGLQKVQPGAPATAAR